MRAAVVVLAVTLLATACAPAASTSERAPVPLALRLRTKGSCGAFSGFSYDASCLAAIYVAVRDAAGPLISEECRPLDDAPNDLGEFLLRPPALTFGGLSTNRSVVFEVRGLHDVGVSGDIAALCDRPALTDHWLFWGQSERIDLATFDDTDAGSVGIEVLVECRDCSFACDAGGCTGCAGIGVGTCPASFPTSFCVPANTGRSCETPCQDDGDCFDGALICNATTRHCDPAAGAPSGGHGGLCARCRLGTTGTAEGCDDGLSCVGSPGSDTGFCATPCPDFACARGMTCNHVADDFGVLGAATAGR